MLHRSQLTAIETVDQENLVGSSNVGFGQASGVKYRGTVFTPGQAILDALAFQMGGLGAGNDMDIFLTDVDQTTNLPTGSPLATWTIAGADLSTSLKTYVLSPSYTSMTPGHKYAFYFGPSLSGSYNDDYRDMKFYNNAPSGDGVISIKYDTGAWATEALVNVFQTLYASNQLRNAATGRAAATGRSIVT